MKRFLFATAAAVTMAGAFTAPALAQEPGQYQRGDNDGYNRGDRGRDDNDWRGDGRRDGAERGDRGRDDNDWRRGDDRRGDNNRWDGRRYNGYTMNGRWYFGPPPAQYMNRRDVRFGYHQWRRGERLSSYHRSHYRQVDWRRERFRAPPRGYHYVRDDRGDVLMVALATGLIASIILANN